MATWLLNLLAAPLLNILLPIVVTAAVGWISALYTKVVRKQMEKADRDALQVALTNVAGGIVEAGLSSLGKKTGAAVVAVAPVTVTSPDVTDAVAKLKSRVPDAVARWPVLSEPGVLAEKIVEAVGILRSGAGVANAAPTYPNPETAPKR